MRSHSARSIPIMLLIALLIGVIAAPADAKRPRRYADIYLMDWTICPTKATLTIGGTTDETVRVDAQLPSEPGTSLIEDGPKQIGLTAIPDDEGPVEIEWNNLVDDELMDEDPSTAAEKETITHRAVVHLVWTQRVAPGDNFIRLSLSEIDPRWGRVRVDSCSPPSPPEDGSGDNSPGVKTPASPLPIEEIRELSQELGKNTETGSGLGGSRVPRAQCTIAGTPGNDRITGTRGNDVICGLGGNDVIDGAGGLDVIDGADGNDRVNGGSGNDLLLLGLRGNDRLNGNGGDDRASGGAGVDRLRGSFGDDFLSGGSGDDRLTGGKDRDRIRGGAGSDRLDARDRTRDMVSGGSGLDSATVDRPGGATKSPTQGDHVRGVEQQL